MKDLTEHIGAILWITSGLFSICGILIVLIWNDLKKTLAQVKVEAGKFPEWLIGEGKKGGVVNRDDFFCFCGEAQEKCPIISVVNWRNDILEKGGLISMADYLIVTKELSKITQLATSVSEKSDHQREMVMKELQVIQLQIKNDVVSEMRSLRKELVRNGK
jgi:hypothetical protein